MKLWDRALQAIDYTKKGFSDSGQGDPSAGRVGKTALRFLLSPALGGYDLGQAYKRGKEMNAPNPNIPDFFTPINAMQNTGLAYDQSWSPTIAKGNYGTTVYDLANNISPMTNTGLSYGQEEQAPVNALAQQPAPAPMPSPMPSPMPKVTPKAMPIKMPSDLNYIYGADQSAFQNIDNTYMPPVNAMTQNGGYFDMGKAGSVGGNWVEGAGWMTQADKMFGKTEEDLAFEAEMRRRMASMAQ